MSDYIFNDLSFGPWINTPELLSCNLKELYDFDNKTRTIGHPVFIHRDGLYSSRVCGLDFRTAVNKYLEVQIKKQVLRLLDKSSPVLPDASAIPNGCSFKHNNAEIPSTGLAECAYRLCFDESAYSYSLSGSTYTQTPLDVVLNDGVGEYRAQVENFFSLTTYEEALLNSLPPMRCWDDLLHRASCLGNIYIEDSVHDSLQKESFESSLGRAVFERLKIVDKLAGAASQGIYEELQRKYCHGEKALFSDESETRINDLRDKLIFSVGNVPTLCSFHGKVSHRFFRIHMNGLPLRGRKSHIVYIGYKIL